VIHLKDYIIEDNKLKQVGLGQGLMNYKEIFKLIKSFDIKPNLVFEGVTRDDLKSSIEFIKNIINKEGV
jgi:L-ribulose-5-phosphate 3-epimerase UlaE